MARHRSQEDGVTVMGVREGRISGAYLYMKRIEGDGQDIGEAVKP